VRHHASRIFAAPKWADRRSDQTPGGPLSRHAGYRQGLPPVLSANGVNVERMAASKLAKSHQLYPPTVKFLEVLPIFPSCRFLATSMDGRPLEAFPAKSPTSTFQHSPIATSNGTAFGPPTSYRHDCKQQELSPAASFRTGHGVCR
jgi:hypothetical protein